MSKKFWTFKNAKSEPKIGELMIYGEIADSTWWGDEVTPKQFKKDLDALGDISELNVFINSPGGDVFAGQAIYSILNRLACPVNVYIDGLAASAASIIAMVGDTIRMPKNAMLMIHNPWGMAIGYSSDLRKFADELDKVREAIIPVYQEQTKKEHDEIAEMMNAETWMTAEEALEKGFIHEIEEAKEIAASIRNFDLSRFKNVPKEYRDLKPANQENQPVTFSVKVDPSEIARLVLAGLKPTEPVPPKTENSDNETNPPKVERVLNYQKRAEEALLITKARNK